MRILCDIGGTYARVGLEEAGNIINVSKFEAAGFKDLQGCLLQYCADHNLKPKGALRIATAAYPDESGAWRFVNQNKWVIDPSKLEAKGWQVEKIINDFEASTWALLGLETDELDILKGAPKASGTKCIIGPGTGLGLGYLHHTQTPFVQKTHGGHMPIACETDAQFEAVQATKSSNLVVFENIVSGPGLQALRELYGEKKSLRLFHEFFGLFAANVVITGHAYDGLYLTGGVLEHLMKEGLFDFATFEKWFCIKGAPSVQTALENTPIIHVKTPYPAIKGLLHA